MSIVCYTMSVIVRYIPFTNEFSCCAGFFYLVDSGYGCYRGFLPPFRRERYHLPEFQHGQDIPKSMRELFNYRHSALRSAIERSFSILKNRFPILRKMPPYPLRYQRLFVIACCTLHNYIRKFSGVNNPYFADALRRINPWIDVAYQVEGEIMSLVSPGERPDQSDASAMHMGKLRDAMARSMWSHLSP
jgi:hypothetical protein